MVIGPTLDDMLWWVVLLVLANGVLYIISRPLGIVVTVIVVLFAVGQLVGNRVVLDKATKNITIEKRHFLLIHTRRVIPFETVRNVDVFHKLQKRGESPHVDGAGTWVSNWYWEKRWQLSIDAGSKNVEIYLKRESIGQKGRSRSDTLEADMWHLANKIRWFIGEEELLKRQKEATRAKDAAREEAVVSFKRRMKEADKERKKQREEELSKEIQDKFFGGGRN